MEGRGVAWCCTGDGTGSRHRVPMSVAGIRRPACSRDGARKGAVSAIRLALRLPVTGAAPGRR